MKNILLAITAALLALCASAQTGQEKTFQTWAPIPPMGWNSWDCFGPTVVESEVKANADYMAERLKDFGWEYVVVDIRWFVENDKAGGYNQKDPRYVIDEWGRYTPAENRFPSASGGNGFKPLADYIHDKGLKFGIHIMRGIPKQAVEQRLPVKGISGITADMIANNDSACTWLRDNMKVDWTKPGAQEYYNSIFDLYASWGVDFVKVDDLSRPYHTAEVEMIRNAIDQCGRPMVLSISPGETPIDKMEHVRDHANMWRTVDDFWDNWNQLNYQFEVCAKWAPYISSGGWPDADMLPLGRISIRGERGAERWSGFTPDEQKTMMDLWGIFRSPLMFGGDLPQNTPAIDGLLTNTAMLDMHHWSQRNREVYNHENRVMWSAISPFDGSRYAALFNIGGGEYLNPKDALWRSGTISYLTTGHATTADVAIPAGSSQLVLVVTDGGDGFDSDHADWINPTVVLGDGSTIDLTESKILRKTCGWGDVHINSNINGQPLKVDNTLYDKGIATHANSILIFDIPEEAVGFRALCGLDNSGTDQGSKTSVEFFVFNYDPTFRTETTDPWNAGGRTLKIDPAKQAATSGFMSLESDRRIREIEADIRDAEKLYLVVTNGGDNFNFDHADWVNPSLVREDGSSVSLTSVKWDENPINGWNEPKVNRNNEGNALTLDGKKYDEGFGVNAPSMLSFSLPENHDFVTFSALVGLDSDTDSAPDGATVEFRVFTQNPVPDNDADVVLDLEAIGFAPDARAEIREVWQNDSLGIFSGSEFAPTLREHASGLYRVTPLDRADNASVEISKISENEEGKIIVEINISGAGTDGDEFIVVYRDGDIIGIIPVVNNAPISFSAPGSIGNHTYRASYSGSLSVAPAESKPMDFSSAKVLSDKQLSKHLSFAPGVGNVLITSSRSLVLPIYNVDGQLVKNVKINGTQLSVNLPQGTYVAAGKKFKIK